VLASVRLIQQIFTYLLSIKPESTSEDDEEGVGEGSTSNRSTSDKTPRPFDVSSNKLTEPLARLEEELQFMRLELDCNSKIAQSQLIIVGLQIRTRPV
jgi:hypothetical protein